jgi:Trk K+ transport system NAD-binding subunit
MAGSGAKIQMQQGDRRARWQRMLRAQLRDTRVLLRESRYSLLLFVVIIVGGGLIFHFVYEYPDTGGHPSLAQALHATFGLIFFDTILPFPEEWYLEILFFLIPIIGLAAVADGVLRLGAALLNKQARGQQWQVAMASTYSGHIVVCGLGKVGYRVTQELVKFGRDIVALESDPDCQFVEEVKGFDIPVIIANARRRENLIKAGVPLADAIVPCTDDELANLDIALDARELNPIIKVVLRMYDGDLARRVEKGFGIHTAFSTAKVAAPIFAAAAMRVNVQHSFYAGDELMIISEFLLPAGSPLEGSTVAQLEKDHEVSVVHYQHGGEPDILPELEVRFSAGDRILVLAPLKAIQKLAAFEGGR